MEVSDHAEIPLTIHGMFQELFLTHDSFQTTFNAHNLF